MDVLGWLPDSDPAIRWQVLRDLVHAPAEVVAAERARARLLALQGEDGQWAGGACFPAESFNWRIENRPAQDRQVAEHTHPGRIHFALEDGDDKPAGTRCGRCRSSAGTQFSVNGAVSACS